MMKASGKDMAVSAIHVRSAALAEIFAVAVQHSGKHHVAFELAVVCILLNLPGAPTAQFLCTVTFP